MKKILALAAVAALTAGVSAYAANPFSDVSEDDWAYQAVSDLSVQGVVEGYPDGTFKGERNMTRYELAQIVARMLAKEDQLNAEQKATLDKLAAEFADELANLGVRVGNLEKKVGNIYWSGDARMMYMDNAKKGASDTWNGRMRINVKGQVNESTYVQGRLKSQMDYKDGSSADTVMDRLFVHHDFGKDVSLTLGRQTLTVFGGLQYDSALDGVRVDYAHDKLDAYVGFGKLQGSDRAVYKTVAGTPDQKDTDRKNDLLGEMSKEDVAFIGFGYDLSKAKFNAVYFGFTGDWAKQNLGYDHLWGVNLVVPIQKVSVFAEYWDSNAKDNDTTYQVGVGYSTLNYAKPGSFDLNLAYNKVGERAYLGGTTYDASDFFDNKDHKDLKFWQVFGDVVLQKNVYLHGEYAFNIKNAEDCDSNAWMLSLNYKY